MSTSGRYKPKHIFLLGLEPLLRLVFYFTFCYLIVFVITSYSIHYTKLYDNNVYDQTTEKQLHAFVMAKRPIVKNLRIGTMQTTS